MKITKKVREDAAVLCALTASRWVDDDESATTWSTASHTGSKDEVKVLADAAWEAVVGSHRDEATHRVAIACVYAEAESLLRSGWSPGDKP